MKTTLFKQLKEINHKKKNFLKKINLIAIIKWKLLLMLNPNKKEKNDRDIPMINSEENNIIIENFTQEIKGEEKIL